MTRFESAGPAARAASVAAAALALSVVVAVGTATIALIGLGRLPGTEVDPARVPGWFLYYRHDPEVRRWLAIGALSSALGCLTLAAAAALSRKRPLHGAARWATPAEQRRAGLHAREGIILGRRGRSLLVAGGQDHVMLYAPTRTGKGVGVVIPNLLSWPHSAVVLDIKRENFEATAGWRAQAGQRVLMFDPFAPEGRTTRYNPLGHIHRTDPQTVLDEVQRIAVMMFTASPHADPFWSEAARTGFIGVAALVAASPDRPFTFGEIHRLLTEGDPRTRLPALLKAGARSGNALSPGCVSAVTDFCACSDNTFSSVRQTLTTRLNLWLNPAVDQATSASDFHLTTLREGRMSLFLGTTPDNLLRVAPLYALLFQQLIDLNSRSLPGPGDRPVLVLLDEFARLGPAPVLAHAFSWVAGYGLRLLPVIQSPSQLRGLYGPDLAEEIVTNCGIEVVFAPKELRTAQELSERLGHYTYRARSRSRPGGLSPGRRSLTESDQRRALMLPQELIQMRSDTLLVLKAGLPPVRARKIRHFADRPFTTRLRPAPPVPAAPKRTHLPSPHDTLPTGDGMDFDTLARQLAAEGPAPPAADADEVAFEDWIDRTIDGAAIDPHVLEAHER